MYIYLLSRSTILTETERNFIKFLEAKFTNISVEVISSSDKEKKILKSPGLLFTNTNFEKRDFDELDFNNTVCYADYAQNDSREFILTDIDDKAVKLCQLDEKHADGLFPIGLFSFNQEVELYDLLKASNCKIAIMPEKNQDLPKSPALFLDRDGIINIDTGYLIRVEDLIIQDGIENIISFFNKKKWPVICLTNQSGVARGMFQIEDVKKLHNEINKNLNQKNANIDHFEISPYHYEKGVGNYKKHSVLRKPYPGMLLKSSTKFNIDFKKSLMIGDKNSDSLKFVQLKTILLSGNYNVSSQYGEVFTTLNDIYYYLKKIYTH